MNSRKLSKIKARYALRSIPAAEYENIKLLLMDSFSGQYWDSSLLIIKDQPWKLEVISGLLKVTQQQISTQGVKHILVIELWVCVRERKVEFR